MPPTSIHRQLHFVTGKGGVGKSTVSCALAQHFVDQGHRTLLVQVNAKDSHAAMLGIPAVVDDVQQARPNLWTVNLNPVQATREYALMTLKIEAVYRAVFENRLTRTFLRFVPSLNELTMMGKLWFHAEEGEGNERRFERIVVDCPSTGHALKLFTISRVLTETVRVGPMVEKTRQMSAVFNDPRRTAVHVVTLPEELPVNETLELVESLEAEDVVTPGALIINQWLAPLFDDERRAALARLEGAIDVDGAPDGADLGDAALAPVVDIARRRAAREQHQHDQRGRLARVGLADVTLPLIKESPLRGPALRPLGRTLIDVVDQLATSAGGAR